MRLFLWILATCAAGCAEAPTQTGHWFVVTDVSVSQHGTQTRIETRQLELYLMSDGTLRWNGKSSK